MASIIRIKRSSVSGNPGTLGAGELAYSNLTDNGSNGGDRLYIGMGTESNGNAANHVVIGGKFFTDRLDHTAGTLTASSAIVVDSNSKIDQLNVDNLTLNGNTISSTNTDGNIVLTPNGDGYVTISGTNALVIPKGTSLQQAPSISGAIRFNTDNTSFEGYNGTAWSSLGGVRSPDNNTYVTALDTGDISFYSDTTNVVTVNGDGIDIKTTTATTSDGTTGALKVAGGASIQGNLFVGGNLYGIDEVSSDSYLAAQGNPSGTGTTGYSFQNDGGFDTGMFSASDGILSLYSNNNEIVHIDGTSVVQLNAYTLRFNNDSSSAWLSWASDDSHGVRLTSISPTDESIRPSNDGYGVSLYSKNTDGDSTSGHSSLLWEDWDINRSSSANIGFDGFTINNYDNSGTNYNRSWKFDLDGRITFPDSNSNSTGGNGLSYSKLWAQDNNTFVLNPNTDNNNSDLRIGNWDNQNRIELWNSGNQGMILGNWDNGDSSITIGGPSGSWYDANDDIALYAKRDGKLYLRTNNNDVVLKNDSGEVTFRNSDGHLVIPGVVETNDATGDVILAASNGTEKNAVFTGAGWLTLPDVGFQWYDTNNISGTKVAEMGFDGELYINNYNNQISLYANDNKRWQFTNNNNGELVLPNGAFLSDGSGDSILLGHGVQLTGNSKRISIGNHPDSNQSGQSWSAISIGARAGTTNQGENSIAMGNRAGNSGQGVSAVAIGSSPNSSVGGAGNLNQGNYAVAIGAQAGETSQSSSAIAVGYLAGQTSQGNNAVAIGVNAGQVNQQQNAVAIGNNAGHTGQSLTSIAIGEDAADTDQGYSAIALGRWAGSQYQGQKAIAIGRLAGRYSQGAFAVAIGHHAGQGVFDTSAQGINAIAIGAHAAEYSQHDNSIVLQATATGNGTGINPNQAGLFIDPIRNYNAGSQFVIYNSDTKEVTYNATNIEIDGSTIQSTIASGDADIILEPLGAGTVDVSGARITGLASPINATDAANRSYVDSKISGLTWKDSVNLLSDANIPLTGSGSTLTIDSHATLTASDNGYRILLINQDTATENGIYVYDQAGGTYTLTRSVDTDTYQELIGMAVYVLEGTNYGRTAWVQSNHYITSFADQEYVQFAGAGAYTAGDGLSQSGVTFSVNVAASGGIEIVDDNLQLKSTLAGDGLAYADGVLSVGGTSNRITVNSNSIDIADTYVGQTSITTLGTITSGTWNGTTLGSGYGGTGFSTYAKGDLIYASATNTLSKLTGGDDGKVLQMNASGVPVWGDIDGGTY